MSPAGEAESLRAEIQRTRADLTETIAEIAARTNVRARVGRALADPVVRQRMAAVGVAGLLVVVGVVARRAMAARRGMVARRVMAARRREKRWLDRAGRRPALRPPAGLGRWHATWPHRRR